MSIQQITHRQLIAKGQSDLALLGKNMTALDARMKTIAAELATLAAREQARATHLATLRQTANHHQAEQEKLSVQTELQAGTLAQGTGGKQTQDAAKLAEKAAKALTDAERKAAAEQENDARQMATLLAERQKLEADLAAHRSRERSVNAVIAEAQQAIGEDILRHIVQKFDALDEAVRKAEHSLQYARFQVEGHSTEALALLSEWPTLQAKIRPRLAVRDSSTTIIEQAILLLDGLITGGKTAQVDTDTIRKVLPWSSSLQELLQLDDGNLWPAFSPSANDTPAVLIERRDSLVKLLQVYRNVRRGIPT